MFPHQVAGLLHRPLAEAIAQLPDDLLTQQVHLLRALSLDSLGVDARLLLQLSGDPL